MNINQLSVDIPCAKIVALYRQNHISKLFLFGSVLRSDFRPNSDIDVLIEFISGQCPGFFGLADMEIELSEMLGRKVDLRTSEELSRYFRQKVLDSAQVLYVHR